MHVSSGRASWKWLSKMTQWIVCLVCKERKFHRVQLEPDATRSEETTEGMRLFHVWPAGDPALKHLVWNCRSLNWLLCICRFLLHLSLSCDFLSLSLTISLSSYLNKEIRYIYIICKKSIKGVVFLGKGQKHVGRFVWNAQQYFTIDLFDGCIILF